MLERLNNWIEKKNKKMENIAAQKKQELTIKKNMLMTPAHTINRLLDKIAGKIRKFLHHR